MTVAHVHLLHVVTTEPRLPQVPQLRGHGCLWISGGTSNLLNRSPLSVPDIIKHPLDLADQSGAVTAVVVIVAVKPCVKVECYLHTIAH